MITQETIKNIVKDHFFTVQFVKKDGTERTMNCRLGVKKHLRGGESTIKDHSNLLSVYDLHSKGYRTVNLETLKSLTVDGVHYSIKPSGKVSKQYLDI